ncbi:MAG: MATE family efflux transporter [Pacificimonas sp.]|nr:MATE family efflux transporter [Pacificimonas sp.]
MLEPTSPAAEKAIKGPPTLNALLTLAWPVVLSRLGIMAMGITDAVVVARYSAEELAYQSLGWAPTMVILTGGIGLLIGTQVVTAQFVGEGRRAEAGAVLHRGLMLALGAGLFVALLAWFGAEPMMVALNFEGNLGPEAAAVVEVLAYSMPLYLIGVTCAFWLEALERPLPGMWIMWGANIVNLALNLWLVPGTSPFPVDGAVASSWTTLFSRGTYAVALIAFILMWGEGRGLGVLEWRPSRRFHTYWGRMLRVGSATAVSYTVESIGFAALTIMAGWVGVTAAAAFGVVFNILGLVFMLPLGFAAATAVLVGKAYGDRDAAGVKKAGWLGLGFTTLTLVGVSLLLVPLGPMIALFYSSEADMLALAVPALLLACIFFPLDGFQVIAAQALRAAEDAWVPTMTHTVSYTFVMLPLGYWLGIEMGGGINGLMWAAILASLAACLFLGFRFVWLVRSGGRLPGAA